MFLHIVFGLIVVSFLVFFLLVKSKPRIPRAPSQDVVYVRYRPFDTLDWRRHSKWTCRVTPKFYDDFLNNEEIRKEVRLVWNLKFLVVHVPFNPPSRGSLVDKNISVQGNDVRCIEDFFMPDMTRCITIDDSQCGSCDEPRKVTIAYRIAIAFQPRLSKLHMI